MLGALAFASLAPLAGADEAKLKAAAFLPVKSVYVQQFMRLVDHANQQCKGKVAISVVGPEAIKSLEQWNALKSGVVDMHYGPPNYYVGALPEGDVISVARNESAQQRSNGAWQLINEVHNQKLNAWYLTQLMNGVRFHIYTSKPAQGGRFDGLRLRSTPIYDEFFKSLGGLPVRMAPPEVYTGLERGAVDGYGWPLWGMEVARQRAARLPDASRRVGRARMAEVARRGGRQTARRAGQGRHQGGRPRPGLRAEGRGPVLGDAGQGQPGVRAQGAAAPEWPLGGRGLTR
jgi:hypothetical protein